MTKKRLYLFIFIIISAINTARGLTPTNTKIDDKFSPLTELPGPTSFSADTADTDEIQLTEGQILLTWKSTGPWEDTTGYLSLDFYYKLKYSTSIINSESAWNSADTISHNVTPADSGETQNLILPTNYPTLYEDSTYYFAIRSYIDASKKVVDTTGDTNIVYVSDTSSLSYTSVGKKPHKDDIPLQQSAI